MPLGGNCESDTSCAEPLICGVSGKLAGTCTETCIAQIGGDTCARLGDDSAYCFAPEALCAKGCRADSECEGAAICQKHPQLGNYGERGFCRHGRELAQ